MKYLLMIHMNPTLFESLSEEEQSAVIAAHEGFQEAIRESGELVGFAALADPSLSSTVRVRDDVPAVTDGPYIEAKEFLAGYWTATRRPPAPGTGPRPASPPASPSSATSRPAPPASPAPETQRVSRRRPGRAARA